MVAGNEQFIAGFYVGHSFPDGKNTIRAYFSGYVKIFCCHFFTSSCYAISAAFRRATPQPDTHAAKTTAPIHMPMTKQSDLMFPSAAMTT